MNTGWSRTCIMSLLSLVKYYYGVVLFYPLLCRCFRNPNTISYDSIFVNCLKYYMNESTWTIYVINMYWNHSNNMWNWVFFFNGFSFMMSCNCILVRFYQIFNPNFFNLCISLNWNDHTRNSCKVFIDIYLLQQETSLGPLSVKKTISYRVSNWEVVFATTKGFLTNLYYWTIGNLV